MATHYLKSDTSSNVNLYRAPRELSVTTSVPNNTPIELVEENVGSDCSYAKVLYNNTMLYAKTNTLFRLPTTPESAPYVCEVQYNSNYQEPDWIYLENDIPFYNSYQTRYKIPLLTEYKTIQDMEQFKKDSIKQGLVKLFKYYNKDYSQRNIDKILSYYKFADFEDFYVRPISNTKIKALISVPAKYFEAQQSYSTVLDIDNGKQVISISTKNLRKKMQYIKMVFDFYSKTLEVSNVEIHNFSFKNEFEKMLNFFNYLNDLFEINEMPIKEQVDETLEIVLDQCDRFFAASIGDGITCKYPVVGLSNMRENQYSKNSRVLNYFKHIDSIYQIDPCRMSVTEFIERYVLHPPDVSNVPNIRPLSDYYDFNELLGYVKNLVNKLNNITHNTPTTQEFYRSHEEELSLAINDLKTKFSWSNFYDSKKDIFEGINFTKDLDKISNMKKSDSKYNNFAASIVPEDTKSEAASRTKTIKYIYNVLSFSQILCKLAPKALQCLLQILATTAGEISGVNVSLSLVTVANYSLEEIRTKVFPFLTAEEKRIILGELLDRFCLTNSDLISILKSSKNLSNNEVSDLRRLDFVNLKIKILNEINI